jgi:lysozyme family protein
VADFSQAHKFVEQWEGFHDDDPDDPGGETLYGISRKNHPNWGGWPTWDANRRETEKQLSEDARRELHEWRDMFYRREFWHPLRLQEFPSRRLAIIVYQAAVNCGVRRVARWLQQSLNAVAGADIIVDGRVGNHTLHAVQVAFEKGYIRIVEDAVIAKQRQHYEFLADGDPRLGKFLKGWMNRAKAVEAL